MDIMQEIAARAGGVMGLMPNDDGLNVPYYAGYGDLAPGVVAEGPSIKTAGRATMNSGRGAILIVGGVLVALVAFRVWTGGYQA